MIKLDKKEKCSGCGACFNVCPRHCIAMAEDSEGFAYPKIRVGDCIDCHLCEKVCPIANPVDECTGNNPTVLSAIANDKIRMRSSSGGIFALLAQRIIRQNGVVFGAVFDKDFNVCHTCAYKEEDIIPMMGSKYVQSNTRDTFIQVKKLVKEKKVLYVGTPCQIEGLRAFLDYKDVENLYTVDFICHGVPSPKIWRKYLHEREKECGGKFEHVFHRDKRHGWKTFSMSLDSSRMSYSKILTYDKYLQAFLRNYSLRPSCYECPLKKTNRLSDITLADFWGISRIRKGFDDDKGTSLVMLHSDKGRKFFDDIRSEIRCNEEPIEVVKRINYNMVKSVEKPKGRDDFFANIDKFSFDVLYIKYVRKGLAYEIKNMLKGGLKIFLHKLHYEY